MSIKTALVNDLGPVGTLPVADEFDSTYRRPERRAVPRIYDPFPARVQGIDIHGRAFETLTALDNISADGLYLRLMADVRRGTKLYIVLSLASEVTVQGEVIRVESKPGSAFGVAVRIKQHKFK
ncbi:MAG TPA: PilZ domain-containing protein [Pyrinomonadaceae bacterium]|nr:PilZ domain-containing protein [Pyrinomonadaceae bacterium]